MIIELPWKCTILKQFKKKIFWGRTPRPPSNTDNDYKPHYIPCM